MNHSMINASVSMHGIQQKLDILSNNIANVNTAGYKKKEASFEDVLTNIKSQPKGFRQGGRMTPLGYNQGWGSKLAQVQTSMTQGPIQPTENPLDVAIQGNGLFEVIVNSADQNGNVTNESAWTRSGAFNLALDKNGNNVLATKDGHFVSGVDGNPISIPNNYKVKIDSDGKVTAYSEVNSATPINAGQIKLVRMVRPQLLKELGDNLYRLPQGVAPQDALQTINGNVVNPAEQVKVMQGYLEQSNVNLSDEMTELVMVQRAFQLNSRAITSADTMMGLANNLRG